MIWNKALITRNSVLRSSGEQLLKEAVFLAICVPDWLALGLTPCVGNHRIFVGKSGHVSNLSHELRTDGLANVVHEGVYFSLADTATGSAMASHGYVDVTVCVSHNYFRSGKAEDVITAQAREVKGGKTLCGFNVALTDQDGKLVGSGSFTYYRRLQQPSRC